MGQRTDEPCSAPRGLPLFACEPAVSDTDLLKTPLHALHTELGARMVPFAGYAMPVSYPGGILAEHRHCRSGAALFDVSHMGQLRLVGEDAAAALESLVPVDVVDLAVGVIVGAAFGKIVSSVVADVVMPLLGLLVGGINFSDMAITLKAAAGDQPAVLLAYGKLIQSIFDFVIVAFAIFMAVKGMNSLKKKEEAAPAAPAAPSAQEVLLAEIRDLLKKK